jgi:hypothetical protein
MSKKDKIKWFTEGVIFLILSIYILFLWLFKEATISHIDVLVPFSVWFFTLTIGAMIPGIIYEGGKGYSKIFGSHLFTTKEKGFVFFLLELIVGFFLVLLFGLFLSWALPLIKKYLVLIFVEWVLLVYVWFTRMRKYKFPWFYTIITNLIIIFWGVIIYFYL